MSSQSDSPLDIFSPRLKLVTQMLRLTARDENITSPQQQQQHAEETSIPKKFTYVMSSEGIEVRQPHVENDPNCQGENADMKKDASPCSISSSKTEGSEIEVSPEPTTPSIAVVEKADVEEVVPPLCRRRGRYVQGLEVDDHRERYYQNLTFAIEKAARTAQSAPEYSFVKDIGSGGEGVCSLVKRRKDKQLFAVKLVKRPRLVQRRPIEAVVKDLFEHRHKNIIRLHHWTSVANTSLVKYYFEYCEGGDLYKLVRQYELRHEHIPELFIWHTFLSIAGALEFLHRGFDPKVHDRIGVVHRDVKPENIFLRLPKHKSDYPDVVLADFGMASFDFATYDTAGTVVWQPPELPRKAPKGDVWSLGAVIHYMIFREIILAGLPEDVEKTSENERRWEASPDARQPLTKVPEPYSPELVRMMLTACEKDHNKRIDSSRLLMTLTAFKNEYLSPYQEVSYKSQLWPLEGCALAGPVDEDDIAVLSDGPEQDDKSATYGNGTNQYFEAMQEWCFEKFWQEHCDDSPTRSLSLIPSPKNSPGGPGGTVKCSI